MPIQVLCSLGFTLEITYPAIFERCLSAVRSLANFDAFALPGFSCLVGSSVIGKFWVSALLPPGIGLIFGISYLFQVYRIEDSEVVEANSKVVEDEKTKKIDDLKASSLGIHDDLPHL